MRGRRRRRRTTTTTVPCWKHGIVLPKNNKYEIVLITKRCLISKLKVKFSKKRLDGTKNTEIKNVKGKKKMNTNE